MPVTLIPVPDNAALIAIDRAIDPCVPNEYWFVPTTGWLALDPNPVAVQPDIVEKLGSVTRLSVTLCA